MATKNIKLKTLDGENILYPLTTVGNVIELEDKLAAKQDTLTPGIGINITGNAISVKPSEISYNDLADKPTIPTKTSDLTNDSNFITSSYHDSTKQDTLISGTNIKTINGDSPLGSGNVAVGNVIYGTPTTPLDLSTIQNEKGSATYGFTYSDNVY